MYVLKKRSFSYFKQQIIGFIAFVKLGCQADNLLFEVKETSLFKYIYCISLQERLYYRL